MGRLMTVDGGGIKSIDFPQYSDDAWTWYSGKPQTAAEQELYQRVSFVFRCAQLTAGSVQQMPFSLVDSRGEDYDTSADWQNKIGFLPEPAKLFSQVELALFMWGRAYLFNERKGSRTVGLRYIVPTSIEPKLDGDQGLTGFIRTYTNGQKQLAIEDLLYFWAFDPFVEIGPPQSSRFMAAAASAGVLREMDKYIAEFISRGGVLPTMLMVKGIPPNGERERLETYWDKFIKGAFKVAGKIFNAEGFEAKTVGEGLSGFKDNSFTQTERESIAAAAGVPLSMVMSNASNYATALSDRRVFWENTIIPECDFIAGVLNTQLFAKYDLHLEWRPETVDAFQEDENSRAAAYAAYVGTGMKPSVAAQVVGIELPAGMEYDDLDPEEEPEPEAPEQPEMVEDEPPAQEEPEAEPAPATLSLAALRDLEIWRRKAIKAVAHGDKIAFTTTEIPDAVYQTVTAGLVQAGTVDQVRAVFAGVTGQVAETRTDDNIKALLEAIKLGVEALKHDPTPSPD